MAVPELINEIQQAAFRDVRDGRIFSTGPTHNPDMLPKEADLDYLEDGFLTHKGKFITRLEATKLLYLNRPIQSEELSLAKTESMDIGGDIYEFTGPELNNSHFKITARHKGKEVGEFTFWSKPITDPANPHFGWYKVGGTHVHVLHRKKGINPKMMQIASKFIKEKLQGKGLVSEGSWRSEAATGSWEKMARKVKGIRRIRNRDEPDVVDFRLSEDYEQNESLEKMAIADIRAGQPAGTFNTNWMGMGKPRKVLGFDYSHVLPEDVYKEGYRLLMHDFTHPDNAPNNTGLRLVLVHRTNPANILGEASGGIDGEAVEIDFSDLLDELKDRKIGKALYSAFLAHAYHAHGIREVEGGTHSSMAHRVHQSLSRQHGMDYKADPNIAPGKDAYPDEKSWAQAPDKEFDAKYKPYQYTIKSEIQNWLGKAELGGLMDNSDEITESDHAMAVRMLAVAVQDTPQYQAAMFLSQKAPSYDDLRESLVRWDNDFEMAVLEAFGLDCTEENRTALRGIVKASSLNKSDISVASIPRDILAPHKDGHKMEAALMRGMAAGMVKQVDFEGKHSKGMAIIKDPETNKKYLIKPGSGKLSPSAGVSEEPASQSKRETAFAKIAEAVGLGRFVNDANIIMMDEQECAAMGLLSGSYEGMEQRKKKEDPQNILGKYLENGDLFKWSVLDYLAGNADRHAGNIMVNDENEVKLIDHGSAFAGRAFNPAEDKRSFVPFYLRAFSEDSFSALDADGKYDAMPKPTDRQDKSIGNWIGSLDKPKIKNILQEYGLKAEFVTDRLDWLLSLPVEDRLDWLLSFYSGLTTE